MTNIEIGRGGEFTSRNFWTYWRRSISNL